MKQMKGIVLCSGEHLSRWLLFCLQTGYVPVHKLLRKFLRQFQDYWSV